MSQRRFLPCPPRPATIPLRPHLKVPDGRQLHDPSAVPAAASVDVVPLPAVTSPRARGTPLGSPASIVPAAASTESVPAALLAAGDMQPAAVADVQQSGPVGAGGPAAGSEGSSLIAAAAALEFGGQGPEAGAVDLEGGEMGKLASEVGSPAPKQGEGAELDSPLSHHKRQAPLPPPDPCGAVHDRLRADQLPSTKWRLKPLQRARPESLDARRQALYTTCWGCSYPEQLQLHLGLLANFLVARMPVDAELALQTAWLVCFCGEWELLGRLLEAMAKQEPGAWPAAVRAQLMALEVAQLIRKGSLGAVEELRKNTKRMTSEVRCLAVCSVSPLV